MIAVNETILVGGLGHVPRDSLDDYGRAAYEAYADALKSYRAAFEELASPGFAEAARRLREAMRQLRELAGPFAIPKRIEPTQTARINRTAAFFHAAKVDARNLP